MTGRDVHVLLGAGGAVGNVLARALLLQERSVRLVSRSGRTIPGASGIRADLLDARSVLDAVPEGATAYLLAGLPYRADVWEDQWPRIMRNAIDACSARRARLIFFDNVYMYGAVDGPMTEETPFNPRSRKGRVRARVAEELVSAAGAGRLEACIARSADFYGTVAGTSIPHALVFGPLVKGQRARWLANASVPHSFTYIPDCARALPLLADAGDVWGRVWHLPTAGEPPTGKQFVDRAARALGRKPRLVVLPSFIVRLGGLFDRTVAELVEMMYQYDRPYLFDSSKFERRFGVRPTPYAQGIAENAAAEMSVHGALPTRRQS